MGLWTFTTTSQIIQILITVAIFAINGLWLMFVAIKITRGFVMTIKSAVLKQNKNKKDLNGQAQIEMKNPVFIVENEK